MKINEIVEEESTFDKLDDDEQEMVLRSSKPVKK